MGAVGQRSAGEFESYGFAPHYISQEPKMRHIVSILVALSPMRRNPSGAKTSPALGFAITALVLCGGAVRGQPSHAEMESRALVSKIVTALGGEAAVARVRSTRLRSTRHMKTTHGDAVTAVDRIVDYPDRIWMHRKAAKSDSTIVVTPEDSFMVTAGAVRDLPAAVKQEAARAIKLGLFTVAQHAQDAVYNFAVRGEENVRGVRTAVLEIAVNGDWAIWNVDPSTGRVMRETRTTIGMDGKPSQTTFDYSDWRAVEGILVPFRMIGESGSTATVEEVVSWEINPNLPPSLFERPSATAGTSATVPQAATGPAPTPGTAPKIAADRVAIKRDEPLQTTWLVPKKIPSVKSHEGLWRADTYSWQCYPVVGQSFKGDRKWLLLKISIDGPGALDVGSIVVFAVDGEVVQIPPGDLGRYLTWGGNRGVEITLSNQETLVSRISGANEVWVTLPEDARVRHSVRLSEPQLQVFRDMIERYRVLEPK